MTDVFDDVIPISRLFFDDAGPHVVSTTSSPEEFGGTTLAGFDAERIVGRSTPAPPPLAATAVDVTHRHTSARGRDLHKLLGTSIAQLGGVSGGTRKTPASPPPVPIDSLLYRGRAALDRALEIRNAARRKRETLTAETIEELLDLIGLAAEE